MTEEVKKSNQTRFNFYSNIATLAATVIVGVYYTPYLVNQLGLAAYGVIPLAMIINQYISVVTGSLTGAFTRFYSVSLQQNKYAEASKNISTSLLVILIIIGVLIPFLSWLVWKIDNIFNIPQEYIVDAKFLFSFTIFSFFISLISSLFHVTLYALNRLDLMNILKIFRNVSKLCCVILFFTFCNVNIAYVGISGFITESIILVISIILFYKNKPVSVRLNFRSFSKPILFAILGMTSWVIIHQIGDTVLYRIDNIVVNKFWGIENSGALGAVSEFGTYVLLVVSVIGTLFGPLILIAYSKGDHTEVKTLALNQSYIVGALSAILAGVIAGYSKSLLSLWLGSSFAQYSDWLALKTCVVPFYAAGGVLAYIYRSWNKVMYPAIATLVIGMFNVFSVLVIAYLFPQPGGIIMILVICTVFSVLQCYFLNCYCVNKIYKGMQRKLLLSFLKIATIFVGAYLICNFFSGLFDINNVFNLIVLLSMSSILIFVFVYFVGFNSENRKQVLSFIK